MATTSNTAMGRRSRPNAADVSTGALTVARAAPGAGRGEGARVGRAAAALRRLAGGPLDACVVLGSGMEPPPLEGARRLPLRRVPGLPVPSVPGHAAEMVLGRAHGLRVAVFAGRVHLYEGAAPAEVVRGVRAAAGAGARLLLLTNAAGGVAEWLKAGDFLVLSDHLDLGRGDPAAGEPEGAFGPRFLSAAGTWDETLREAGLQAARRERVTAVAGVYAFLRGPAFETAAEVRMLRALGADAVGMSTVPEALAARRLGMRVFGLSVISNRAGVAGDSHASVLDSVRARAGAAGRVLDAVLACHAGNSR
jgi:purine-nucleoside phosphorylase